jgi:GIY-YIG catalytic domain-containing protein
MNGIQRGQAPQHGGESMRNLRQQAAQPREYRSIFIYGLVDPRNQAIRYIGKSVDPPKRLATHLSKSSLKKHTHKNCWIRSLLEGGLKPKLEILSEVDYRDDWTAEEKVWIARLRNLSPAYPSLTNSTDGGEGVEGLIFSEETRKRMSEIRKGVPLPDETKEKIRAAHIGRSKSPEHCENMSKGQKRRLESLSQEEKRREIDRRRPTERSSQYRGVTKKRSKKNAHKPWSAFFPIKGRSHYIGLFATEEEAAHARDIFVIANIGTDYPLNFPITDYPEADIAKEVEQFGKFKKNTSGYRGVSWRDSESVWLCFVSQKGKSIYLGYFPGTEEGKIEAAHAYDRWVIQHRGPTAYTNFPRSQYP